MSTDVKVPRPIPLSVLQFAAGVIPGMTAEAIERVREIESHLLATQFQFDLKMQHTIHGGVYSRTCLLPSGCVLTGAFVQIPTTLVIDGNCIIWLGDEGREIKGRVVLAASAGRKQAFRAISNTWITMYFATEAKTVAEAEKEFTPEWECLAPGRAETVVTGE